MEEPWGELWVEPWRNPGRNLERNVTPNQLVASHQPQEDLLHEG